MAQTERVETEIRYREGPVAVFTHAPIPIYNPELVDFLKSLEVKTGSDKDPTPEGIYETIGVLTRYHLQGLGEEPKPIEQTVPQMATECAKAVCAQKGWHPKDIQVIIFSTSQPFGPKGSVIIADKIGARPFYTNDINTACTGSINALAHVESIKDEIGDANVLVVASEHITSRINPQSKDMLITMFSDGASALAFQNNKDINLLAADFFGEYNPAIQMPIDTEKIPAGSISVKIPPSEDSYIHMNGGAVLRFIRSPKVIERIVSSYTLLQERQRRIHIVAHPGSSGVLKNLQEKLMAAGLNAPLTSKTLGNFGNFASASVLAEFCMGLEQKQFSKGDIVFMPGVGAGLNYASVAFEILKIAA